MHGTGSFTTEFLEKGRGKALSWKTQPLEFLRIHQAAGTVMLGEVATVAPQLSGDFAKLMGWADAARRLRVRANAETPLDARTAVRFGAEGIGLCRTEHMFFQPDRIVAMLGLSPEFRIIPFRGEYFLLHEKHNRIVQHLIYPVPDPTLPFLGVHLTRMIDGTVTVGPNCQIREGPVKRSESATLSNP